MGPGAYVDKDPEVERILANLEAMTPMAETARISLDDLDAFLAVARCGSFVGAARELGASVSTLSRRVSALEGRVGAQLLKRSTRSIALTADGRAFAERCGMAVAEIAASVEALRDQAASLRGPLRVTAPQYACRDEFGPLLLDFAARNPGLQLDLRLTNGAPDLIEENIDLAFQLTPLQESSHVARRLWEVPYVLCASPAFLERRKGRPLSHPRDLADEPCVLTPPIETWRFQSASGLEAAVTPRTAAARVDDLGLGVAAACAGLGYGFLPNGLAQPHLGGALTDVVLADWRAKPRELYAVYPPSRQLSPKVRALIDFALAARAAHR